MTAARAVALLIAGAVATSPANAIPERREKSMNMNLLDDAAAVLTVYKEAGNQDLRAKLAVAGVILNRMRDKRWPDTAAGVCFQHRQFSCWNPDDPNLTRWPTIHNIYEYAAWAESMAAWDIAMNTPPGIYPATSANHYHSYSVKFPENLAAAWTGGDESKLRESYIQTVGGIHLFRIEE